jgi:hypothetical protein
MIELVLIREGRKVNFGTRAAVFGALWRIAGLVKYFIVST